MHRPDLYRLSRVWLGDALPNSEKKRFPFYGRNGSCDCHAHLVASLGFGLFALCHRFEKKFLGTWIGYFIVSSWMYLIGLMATLATQSPDPSGVVMSLMLNLDGPSLR